VLVDRPVGVDVGRRVCTTSGVVTIVLVGVIFIAAIVGERVVGSTRA